VPIAIVEVSVKEVGSPVIVLVLATAVKLEVIKVVEVFKLVVAAI